MKPWNFCRAVDSVASRLFGTEVNNFLRVFILLCQFFSPKQLVVEIVSVPEHIYLDCEYQMHRLLGAISSCLR